MNLEGVVVHPLADGFPLMGEMELRELAQDIKANGQREPVVLYEGKILDGRNRFLACQMAGVEPMAVEFSPSATGCTPEKYVWSMNVVRRHLRADQKRELIGKLLKADPTKSNRQIAVEAKVSHPTVAAVREEQESRGKIFHVSKTTDTKGRQQPSTKPAKAKLPKYQGEVLTLSSSLDELVTKWNNERGPNEVYSVQVDCFEFTVRRVAPLIDAKAETGRAVREREGAKDRGRNDEMEPEK